MFSATNPDAPPLLTINPSALLFNQLNPGAIINRARSTATNASFSEPQGSGFLVGGDITFDGGFAGGTINRLELGGLAGVGAVELIGSGNDMQLKFPAGVPRADVVFQNNAAATTKGGSVTVYARNLTLSGTSLITVSLQAGAGVAGSRSGDVTINVTGTVALDGNSFIANFGLDNSLGGTGNVVIDAQSIRLTNTSQISTRGERNRGSIRLNATEDVTLDSNSLIATFGSQTSIGESGDITITARTINLSNQAGISSGNIGQGRGGRTILQAQDTISLSSGSSISSSSAASVFGGVNREPSGDIEIRARSLSLDGQYTYISSINFDEGRSGNIQITTDDSVSLNGLAYISSSTAGQGYGGDIQIQTPQLLLSNGALIDTRTSGQGNSGNLRVNASDTVELIGSTVFTSSTGEPIVSNSRLLTSTFGSGNAGQITLNTGRLSLQGGGAINADAGDSTGQGGDIAIRATDAIEVVGELSNGIFSSNLSTDTFSSGNAGNLTLETRYLSIRDGAFVSAAASTNSSGQGGNLVVNASEAVEVVGTTSDGQFSSRLSASTSGQGDAGNLTINTHRLIVREGGLVSASVNKRSTGQGRTLTVNASDSVEVVGKSPNGSRSSALSTSTFSSGDAGRLSIDTRRLSVGNGGYISTATGSSGQGGDLEINATELVEIVANPADTDLADGLFTTTGGSGNAGNLTISTQRLRVRNGAAVSAATGSGSTGRGGNLTITASDSVEVTGTSNNGQLQSLLSVRSRGEGQAGNLTVTTPNLTLKDRGAINAESNAVDGGNITLNVDRLLLLRNNSSISATAGLAQSAGDGGNITVNTPNGFIVAVPKENSDITANAFEGRGGNINITTQGIYGLEFRPGLTPLSDIAASSKFGLDGEFQLDLLTNVDPSRGLAQLPINVVDASEQIDRRCTPEGANQGSSFIITGRGGIPPSPNEPLQADLAIANWVTLDSDTETNTPPSATTTRSSVPKKLVEAQGWMLNEQGQVVLTASAPKITPHGEWIADVECASSQIQ